MMTIFWGYFTWLRDQSYGLIEKCRKPGEEEEEEHLEEEDEEDNEEWRLLNSDGETASAFKADEDDDADISDNPPPIPTRSVTKALQPTQESNDQNNTNDKMLRVPLPLKGPSLVTEPDALSVGENLLSQRPFSNWKPPQALSKVTSSQRGDTPQLPATIPQEQTATEVSTVVEVGGPDQESTLVVGDFFVQCNSPSHEEEEAPMIVINPFNVTNIESQRGLERALDFHDMVLRTYTIEGGVILQAFAKSEILMQVALRSGRHVALMDKDEVLFGLPPLLGGAFKIFAGCWGHFRIQDRWTLTPDLEAFDSCGQICLPTAKLIQGLVEFHCGMYSRMIFFLRMPSHTYVMGCDFTDPVATLIVVMFVRDLDGPLPMPFYDRRTDDIAADIDRYEADSDMLREPLRESSWTLDTSEAAFRSSVEKSDFFAR
ncbi:hypothetical protein L7F22_006533 [Adiantum nelumboides]|nr:hypothetical protein [Adiantum nelumboides]